MSFSKCVLLAFGIVSFVVLLRVKLTCCCCLVFVAIPLATSERCRLSAVGSLDPKPISHNKNPKALQAL